MATIHSGSPDHFANYLAKSGGQQVIRCPYCGHKKPRQEMLCENCLRYPH